MATEEDKVNAGLIGTISISGAIFVLAIAWVVTALVRSEVEADAQAKGAYANLDEIKQIRAEQASAMSSAGVLNADKQLYAIPADRAMKKVVTEIQQDPNAASPPLEEEDDADAGADDAGDGGDGGEEETATDGGDDEPEPKPKEGETPKPPAPKPGPTPAPPGGGQPPAPPGGGGAPAPQH